LLAGIDREQQAVASIWVAFSGFQATYNYFPNAQNWQEERAYFGIWQISDDAKDAMHRRRCAAILASLFRANETRPGLGFDWRDLPSSVGGWVRPEYDIR
jgi:hypothetical protein